MSPMQKIISIMRTDDLFKSCELDDGQNFISQAFNLAKEKDIQF